MQYACLYQSDEDTQAVLAYVHGEAEWCKVSPSHQRNSPEMYLQGTLYVYDIIMRRNITDDVLQALKQKFGPRD